MARSPGLTRAEQLRLVAATLRGATTGAIGAIVTWLLDHFTP